MSNPTPNRNVPGIQKPSLDPTAILMVMTSLKEGVESLAGHRGAPLDRAVTFADLIRLGIVTPAQVEAVIT